MSLGIQLVMLVKSFNDLIMDETDGGVLEILLFCSALAAQSTVKNCSIAALGRTWMRVRLGAEGVLSGFLITEKC